MPTAYQYTSDGIYAETVEDYGLLPSNATHTPPSPALPGHVLRWTGEAWEQVENHKGKQGYVNGQPHTITEYGPLPDGWSDTPPPPTLAEAKEQAMARIDADTSARILAGFEFQPEGQPEPLHFAYDLFDQQNFADAANAALLAQAGTPGVPESVAWNAYRRDSGELVRLTLTPAQFLALYVAGALAHKATCMEEGGTKKAAVEAAATADEVAAVLAS